MRVRPARGLDNPASSRTHIPISRLVDSHCCKQRTLPTLACTPLCIPCMQVHGGDVRAEGSTCRSRGGRPAEGAAGGGTGCQCRDEQGQVCVEGGSRGTQVPNRPWALGLTHSVTGFALPNELMLAPLIPLERRAYASPLIPLQGRAALRTGRHHGSAHRECREGTSPPGRLQRQGRGGEGDTEVSMPGCEVTTGKRIGNQQVPCIFHLQQAFSSGNDLAAVLAAELDAKV